MNVFKTTMLAGTLLAAAGQAALYWNDGRRDYLNNVDGNASHSRVRFTGSGKTDDVPPGPGLLTGKDGAFIWRP